MRLVHHPVLCNYYVTYRCNASCSFCDIWEKPSPYINLDEVDANLKDLKSLGVKVIDFTGGEPLLHRNLDLMLQMAKDLGFITTVTTNTLLYPKYAARLKGLVDMLHFSLDSPIEEEHNRSRNVDCFGHFMDSIKIANELGEQPDILFTVMPENFDQISQVYEEIVIPNNLVLILNPIFDYAGIEADDQFSPEMLKTLSSWGKKKNVYLNEAFIQLRSDGGNHKNDPICKAASSTVVISPNNELILPCYHLGIEKFPIENRLESLVRSEKIQSLVKMEGKYEGCEGCTVNCYMQPSFAVEINRYWWKALSSTLKYNWIKGTWKELI